MSCGIAFSMDILFSYPTEVKTNEVNVKYLAASHQLLRYQDHDWKLREARLKYQMVYIPGTI